MSQHKYIIHLTPQQRDFLSHMICSETRSTHQKMHAQVLLQTDRNQPGGKPPTDGQVAKTLNISSRTVLRVKARFLQEGLMRALRNPSSYERPARRKLSPQQNAQLVALTSSPPPPGHKRWSFQLLADHMVLLQIVKSISKETVRQVLKKMHVSLPGVSLRMFQPRKNSRTAQRGNLLAAFFRLCDPLRSVVATDNLSQIASYGTSSPILTPLACR